MTQAYGGRLRAFLAQNTVNRGRSFLTGFGITALLQSSTATILMTLSFVRQAMIGLPAAIAIMIGADLSTTVVAQVLSLDLSWLSPMLIIVGFVVATKSGRGSKNANVGHMLTGLGLILLALTLLRAAVDPLKDAPLLLDMLTGLAAEPLLAILFSAMLTVLMHSSLATVLLYSSLAIQGVIGADLGILLIMGANIGSTVIPFMLTYNDGAAVRRLTTLNLLMRGGLVIVLLPFVHQIAELSALMSDDPARQIVNLHTGFSLLMAMLALPFVQAIARFGYKVIRPSAKKRGDSDSLYLNEGMLDKPTIALAGAAREALRMADLVESMTGKAFEALKTHNESLLAEAKAHDEKLGKLFNGIKMFLSRLQHDALNAEETRQVQRIMAFATNLEHCGDIIQHSMADTILKKVNAKDSFSPEGWDEIRGFHKAVMENMQIAQSVFISTSTQLASEMIETKKRLKRLEFESRRKHFNRLSEQQPQSLATSGIHIDLMRDLGRINSHMTSIAYETME